MKFIALNVIRHTLNYDTMRRFYGKALECPVPIVKLDIVSQIDDAQAWHDHLHAKGVTIPRGLETQEWGRRSFVEHLAAG